MPWLDIILIGVLVIFALVGLIRGFLRGVLSLFSTLVTLVLAIWLAKPVSGIVDSIFGLTNAFAGVLQPTFLDFFSTNDYTVGWIAQLINVIMGAGYMGTSPTVETISTDFAQNVGNIITIAICAVVLYAIIRVVLWLLGKLFKKITQNRTIGGIDRIFGIFIGLAKGALYIFVVMGIGFFLGSFIAPIGAWLDNMLGLNPVSHEVYSWVTTFIQNTLLPFFFG